MAFSFSVFLLLSLSSFIRSGAVPSLPECDIELLQFALNLEYLEAEFFLFGALGYGLDTVAPNLARRGPPPLGAQKATLDASVRDVILQFAYQKVGHLRAIQRKVGGFPRPLMDLSSTNFARIVENAVGSPITPPFNPYLSSANFLLASYLLPYVGLTSYVGSVPYLNSTSTKRLATGLLAVESGQDAVIRALLYQLARERVYPHPFTVASLTSRLSAFRNRLGRSIDKEQGLLVPPHGWVGGFTTGNILNGNNDSIVYSRTPREILRIVYGTGRESGPGGFFPAGASGTIAQIYLSHGTSACSKLSTHGNGY